MVEHWLTQQGSYQTPEKPTSWVARCCPTVLFYYKILGIVYHGSQLAKKGLYDDQGWIQSSINAVRALESVGGRFDIQGLDIIAQLQSPCVFIGNHMSVLETFVLPCLIQPHLHVTFVVKQSLTTYPFFGHVMRNRNPVVVGRDNPREDLKTVLEDGQRRLEANISVVIFPQTTRSVEFDSKKFNSLGVKLAKRCNVPVVPFALKTDAWGLGRRLKDCGKISPAKTVHIRFGKPLNVSGSGREAHQFIVDFIASHLDAWRDYPRKESQPAP